MTRLATRGPAHVRAPRLAGATRVVATATACGMTPWTISVELLGVGAGRAALLADRLAALTDELTATLRELRGLVRTLSSALEDGFLDELRAGLRDISAAVVLIENVSGQIDRALPVLDATAPTLAMVNGTLDQLNATVAQLETLPGVRIARRIVTRPERGRPALPSA